MTPRGLFQDADVTIEPEQPLTSTPTTFPLPPLPCTPTSSIKATPHPVELNDLIMSAVENIAEPLRARVSAAERDAQLANSKLEPALQRITKLESEVLECKTQLNIKDFEIQSLKSKLEARSESSFIDPDISLTSYDVEKVNEYDSEVPNHTLDPETLTQIKMFSKSRTVFIGNVSRKMYSITERAKDCNVAGQKNRNLLSPSKSRYQRICGYASTQYGVPIDAKLGSEVRRVIDDVNRKFRIELKRRKSKRIVGEGSIVGQENE